MSVNGRVNELNEDQKILGNLTVLGSTGVSGVTGLTAGTTQTQAGAVVGTGTSIRVSTCANANDGVKLPAALKGDLVILTNAGAQNLKVWPASGEKVNTGTADAADATVLATTKSRMYYAFADGDLTKLTFE